ncbi:MAG TPA: hypothetical protein VF698_05760, partial [Thermoanaerobaculia bacterium]
MRGLFYLRLNHAAGDVFFTPRALNYHLPIPMQSPRTRRVQRVHLAQPLVARLGSTHVVLVDVSVLGARVEHHIPLLAGGRTRLFFRWNDEEIEADVRIVRSRLERFSVGSDGLTVYH